jgi:hypothetical protein
MHPEVDDIRLPSVLRSAYRVGDVLVRLEKHPLAYAALSFVLIWTGAGLGLRFVPRWYGGASYTLGWSDALLTAGFVALVGTIVIFAVARNGRAFRNDT